MIKEKQLIDFNLNNYVHVKIKPEGFAYWKERHNIYLPEDLKRDLHHFKDKVDKDGYVKLQAHNFMGIFGEKTMVGFATLFDPTIRIEVETPE